MQSSIIQSLEQAASGFMTSIMEPKMIMIGIVGIFLLSTAGQVVGLITGKIFSLMGLVVLIVAFFAFHEYLPLPANIQTQIYLFLSKLGVQ